jgi:hypothetical protein
MILRLVTGPTIEPVSVDEAKDWLRFDGSSFDGPLLTAIRAARSELDGSTGRLGRALLTQTWELALPRTPCRRLQLPLPPTQSVVSVKYLDALGVQQTLSSSTYRLIPSGTEPAILEPIEGREWPAEWGWSGLSSGPDDGYSLYRAADAFTVRFICGWPTPEAVPESLRAWILARAGAMLAQPESVVIQSVPHRVAFYDSLLAPYRVSWG